MKKRLRVVRWVDLGGEYGRDITLGVNEFAQSHPRWVIRHLWRRPKSFSAIAELHPDGIIVQAASESALEMVRQLSVPVVNVSATLPETGLPTVTVNNRAVGALVAQHLVDRGLRHFAYVGVPPHYSTLRLEGFRAKLREHGFDCVEMPYTGEAWDWIQELEQPNLRAARIQWLRDLPKPIGLYCGRDDFAVGLAELCADCGVHIPDQIALVGSDNSLPYCEASHPALSSVSLNGQVVGFEAARLLDKLMAGGTAPSAPLLVPPRALVIRASSETYALKDERLVKIMQYLREHATDVIYVDQIAKQIGISRRAIQQLFKRHFGRSLVQEILRLRVERARHLLVETDLPIIDLAKQAGFPNQQYLTNVFTRYMGESPAAYRRAHRNA